jgi:hypothetical protein
MLNQHKKVELFQIREILTIIFFKGKLKFGSEIELI